jgi:transcriptional regulator with XRE-family HTH domain
MEKKTKTKTRHTMYLTQTLPDKLRLKRLQKGLSQENMADSLGISTTAYGDLERGRTELTLPRIEKIAELLSVNLGELLEISGPSETEFQKLANENLRLQAENSQLKGLVEQLKRKFQEMIGREILLRAQEGRKKIGF